MALTDEQIERYSRQIIVPRVGGRAQERLLASQLLLTGALDDIAGPLAYLVGAGVGSIQLLLAGDSPAGLQSLLARMRDLNSDSAVDPAWTPRKSVDLALAILGNEPALQAARKLWETALPGVIARLDAPERVAVLAETPPCPRCVSGGLFAPFSARSENGVAIAMVATAEAFKVLAGYEPKTGPSVIEFQGLLTRRRPALPGPESSRCGCTGARGGTR